MATAVQHYVQDPGFEQQAAIRSLVRAMQDAFNAKDAAALAGNLSATATWTNPIGMRARGRDAIERLARTMMTRNARSFARYDIVDITVVRPDVFVVNLVQVPTDRDGNEIEEMAAAPIYVIAREAEGWKIVAGQNTIIATPEGE